MKSQITYLIFVFVQISLIAQPEKGKPGSIESYKVQENYNVLAKDNSIIEGPYELWYKGIKLVNGNFSNNEKVGLWKFSNLKLTTKNEKGEVIDSLSREIYYQGTYKNDKKNGQWKYFLNQKPLCTIYYKDNLRDSIWKSFYPNGKPRYIINYKNGLKNGLYESYLANGTKIISNEYFDDLLNGHYTLYSNDGEIKINIEYKKGIPYTVFDLKDNFGLPLDGGNLKDGTGTIKYYDKNNHLTKLETYKDGIKDGIEEKYYTKGSISEKGTYTKGKKNNDWVYLKTDGTPEKLLIMNDKEESTNTSQTENDVDFAAFSAEYPPQPQGGTHELQTLLDVYLPAKFKNSSTDFSYGQQKSQYQYQQTKIAAAQFGVSATGKVYQFELKSSLPADDKNLIKKGFLSMPPWVPAFNLGFPVEFVYRLSLKYVE